MKLKLTLHLHFQLKDNFIKNLKIINILKEKKLLYAKINYLIINQVIFLMNRIKIIH